MELVIATRNEGKISEIQRLLDVPDLVLRTFRDFDEWPDPEESGDTLEENARIKARAVCEHFGLPAMADDSGLMVEYLDGRPGVHSSRYAGPEGDSLKNIDRLLKELKGVEEKERSAFFECVIVLALPDGSMKTARGRCEGRILTRRRGSGGFGYDPVFLPRGYGRSMAELTTEEKNAISHRGKALRSIRSVIDKLGS